MANGRLGHASWRDAGLWVRSHVSRLLTGAGLAAVSATETAAARKASRQDDKRAEGDSKGRDADDKRDARQESDQKSDNSSKRNDEKNNEAGAESRQKDDSQDKQDRKEARATDTDSDEIEAESNDNQGRRANRRQESDSEDDGGGDDGGREPVELAQNRRRDDEPSDDETDTITAPPVTPTNPNIPADTTSGVPDASDAELIVQGNEDVIASVSTEGGFAFARSGNVIAISGPDGARIIQSDDPDAVVTPSPRPDVPSDDGGNNDVDFTS